MEDEETEIYEKITKDCKEAKESLIKDCEEAEESFNEE